MVCGLATAGCCMLAMLLIVYLRPYDPLTGDRPRSALRWWMTLALLALNLVFYGSLIWSTVAGIAWLTSDSTKPDRTDG